MKKNLLLRTDAVPSGHVEAPTGSVGGKQNLFLRTVAICLMIGIVLALLARPLQKPPGPLDRGKQLYRDGKYEEAAGAYRQVMQENPSNLDAPAELGRALMALKRYPEAIQLLTQTVKQAPSAMDAWQMLGEAYTESHRSAEAIDAFQHVLLLEPTRVHTHLMLGQAYQAIGKKTEARKEWDTVIALDPHNEGSLALKLINLHNRR